MLYGNIQYRKSRGVFWYPLQRCGNTDEHFIIREGSTPELIATHGLEHIACDAVTKEFAEQITIVRGVTMTPSTGEKNARSKLELILEHKDPSSKRPINGNSLKDCFQCAVASFETAIRK